MIDFWRMVYEQGVSVIIMMDGEKLSEDTCSTYWPESGHLGLSDSMNVFKRYKQSAHN